jgi:hypothetical protein
MPRISQKVLCPQCNTGTMQPHSKGCRNCSSGRKAPSPDLQLARKFGINVRTVKSYGGAEKLLAMPPEAMRLILKPAYHVFKSDPTKGGLAGRGYRSKTRGIDAGPLAEARR